MANFERVETVYVLGSTTRDTISRVKTRFSNHFSPMQQAGVNFTTAIDSEYGYLGGTGINIACNLRQFCERDIYLLSVIGDDNEDIFHTIVDNEIKPDYLQTRNGYSTSKARGIIDLDGNHIWLIQDSVTKGTSLVYPESIDSNSSLAIIAPIRKAIFVECTNWAIENNIDYVFDPGMLLASLSKDELVKGIKSSKWLIANETEMQGLLSKSGVTFDEIRASGINIIVTRGAKGTTFYDRFGEYGTNGLAPSSIVDTSGAGDAWRAAFFGSLFMGKGVEPSLKIASSWASFSVEKHGAIGSYPDMGDVYKRAGL
ncbi:hypothetical protein CO180_04495 [candidate division WWE3 bacterium CG_4_9_14_3_um_filter_41_6]|uniref:Carbohydrate kinase PfkB domain-containing protein n=1 Tax=candidate division WWE3 bacterium CG_4_10_14_0_2_um_filter_41_14 TaxID=1975072 RepID=A0A2M7TIY0_UNCKA|nr:MAG: hypothetical protein COY32_03405 [candidate division WWE3 bacterium CG_4_10_14_0_2_um_filter_41_14]PJA38006.1 MAG: hypothetical protein CO180_04495 [candidate division WWE3 bacterium CG_4_9_14_3_um_filter_41_6]